MAHGAKRKAFRLINRRFTQISFLMPYGHVFGQTGRKIISLHLHKDLNPIIVRDGDMFLFVAISRQKKKDFSAPSAPLRLIYLNAMRHALCA